MLKVKLSNGQLVFKSWEDLGKWAIEKIDELNTKVSYLSSDLARLRREVKYASKVRWE